MNSQITQLLESNSPQDRKKAIRMMTQVGGQEAMRALAGLYKYDPDPEIRKLALEAGKSIKRQETAEFEALMAQPPQTPPKRQTTTSTRSVPVVRHEPEEIMSDIKVVFISPAREAQAAEFLERAENHLHSERDKSLDFLVKAFKANPNYRLDTHAMNMAMDLTGMDQNDVYAMLEDDALIARTIRGMRTTPPKEKPKNKTPGRTKDEDGDALWSTVFLDLGLWTIVLASIIMIFMIILIQTYQGAAANVIQGCPTCSPQELIRLRSLVQDTKAAFSISPLQGGLLGVIASISFVFQLLVYYGVLHTALHYYLSPEGTFRGMLHYCVRFDMILYCIVIGLFCAAILLILRDVYDPHYYTLYEESGSPLWKPLINIAGIASLIGGLWSFWRILKYYNEGCFQVGCIMFIAYSIASTILSGLATGFLDAFFESLIKLVLGR